MKSTRPPVSWFQSFESESGPEDLEVVRLVRPSPCGGCAASRESLPPPATCSSDRRTSRSPTCPCLPDAGCGTCPAGNRPCCRPGSCRRRRAVSACPARRSPCRGLSRSLTSLPMAFWSPNSSSQVSWPSTTTCSRALILIVREHAALQQCQIVTMADLRRGALQDGARDLLAVVLHATHRRRGTATSRAESRRLPPPRAAACAARTRRR